MMPTCYPQKVFAYFLLKKSSCFIESSTICMGCIKTHASYLRFTFSWLSNLFSYGCDVKLGPCQRAISLAILFLNGKCWGKNYGPAHGNGFWRLRIHNKLEVLIKRKNIVRVIMTETETCRKIKQYKTMVYLKTKSLLT
jgi:hypothetical protein